MVGVEEGGDEEDAVDYSLGTDPIPDEAERETGRMSRSRVKDFGLDPLHDLKEEEPHTNWNTNRNLIVRPRGGIKQMLSLLHLIIIDNVIWRSLNKVLMKHIHFKSRPKNDRT